MVQPLPPPPPSQEPQLAKWLYLLWQRVLAALTEIPTSDHTSLSNLNSADYSHLTAAQLTDLTDSGGTTLHTHDHTAQTNLNSTTHYHLTQAQFGDLTGGGETTLHTHSTGAPLAHTHAGTDITSAVATATSAVKISSTNWVVEESAGKLLFTYGGASKASLDSSGNLIVTGNVTAYGTP